MTSCRPVPRIPSGYSNAPKIVIAVEAAEMILQ